MYEEGVMYEEGKGGSGRDSNKRQAKTKDKRHETRQERRDKTRDKRQDKRQQTRPLLFPQAYCCQRPKTDSSDSVWPSCLFCLGEVKGVVEEIHTSDKTRDKRQDKARQETRQETRQEPTDNTFAVPAEQSREKSED